MNATFTFEEYVEADGSLLLVPFRNLMMSVLKTRIQKLMMRKRREQHVNQF
jgi:hypothetical protein